MSNQQISTKTPSL